MITAIVMIDAATDSIDEVAAAVAGLDEVELQVAAADCVARAIVQAVLAATSVDRSPDGGVALPSYRDALVGGPPQPE